ncbi:putative uncharacterized protein [Clostridium sp. CAG:921]|nr:putative uncharacterized protein [Clostridium sp. CAG:921]
MKNKSIIIVCVAIVAILAALGVIFLVNNNSNSSLDSLSLNKVMDKVYDGIDKNDLPELEKVEVNSDNVQYFLGTSDISFKEALACEPMISSIAHSVVLVRANDGENVEQLKEKIKSNVNPRKWICVEVAEENVRVESKGNLILLVMVDDYADKMVENFKKI